MSGTTRRHQGAGRQPVEHGVFDRTYAVVGMLNDKDIVGALAPLKDKVDIGMWQQSLAFAAVLLITWQGSLVIQDWGRDRKTCFSCRGNASSQGKGV
jgi:hypothetical protein